MFSLRRLLATKVVDPLVWTAKGMPIGARLREFREQQWDDRETFERRRNGRLSELLLHTVTRIPYYMDRMRDLSLNAIRDDPVGSLAHFPILEREVVRDRLDNLVCEMGRGTVRDHTSGSTNMPVDFYRDKHSITASLATTQLALDWAGVERGERRVLLWGAPVSPDARPFLNRVIDSLHDRTILDTNFLSDELMNQYIEVMNERPVASLEGYPAAFDQIARYARRAGLTITPPRIATTAGFTLYEHMRAQIVEDFGAPVFDQYGNREVGRVSAECDRHEGMHVFGETTILEVVGEDGRPVADGEIGDVVATHLWNYTMPFIRYRMGDRGQLGTEPCSCGRVYPLLARVHGRSGESFLRKDGALVIPDVFLHILGWEFETREVRKFQIVQEDVDRVLVRFVPEAGSEGYSPEERAGITAAIREQLGAPVTVEFVAEEEIEPASSGKYIFAASKVSGGTPEW
jgi:phenylacetate-CoA ligase